MSILDKYPKRSGETASRTIDGEAIVVIPDEGLVRTLNEVGATIWQLSDGTHTIGEIVEIVSDEFDVPWEAAEKDTVNFIMELEGKNMVKLSHEPDM